MNISKFFLDAQVPVEIEASKIGSIKSNCQYILLKSQCNAAVRVQVNPGPQYQGGWVVKPGFGMTKDPLGNTVWNICDIPEVRLNCLVVLSS